MSKIPNTFLYKAHRLLFYGGSRGSSRIEHEQAYVVNVYMVIAFLTLIVFGMLHITEGSRLVGQLELAGASAVLFNALGMRITKNVALARNYLLLTVLVLLIVMLTTGGTQGTGIFWFFVYPLMAFFLAGRKQGIWWMLALYTMILSVLALSMYSLAHTPYSAVTIRQLLVCLGVVAIGVYIHQGVRERAERETIEIERAKSELVALASHQLRTPISAISWFAEILLNGDAGKLTKEQHNDVEQIYRSNQRMTALINDMLLVSNLNLKNLSVKPVKSDISSITRDVIKELSLHLLADKQLNIQEEYAAHLPKVSVDPEIMRIILHNLLANAFKYTPAGGTITISISIRESTQKISRSSRGSLIIEIEDTGYGIPVAAQEKIFTRFFRGKNILEKDTDGTGLGLFTVKNLLDYTGGDISFRSKENKGSTFVIQIPLEGMLKINAESNVNA